MSLPRKLQSDPASNIHSTFVHSRRFFLLSLFTIHLLEFRIRDSSYLSSVQGLRKTLFLLFLPFGKSIQHTGQHTRHRPWSLEEGGACDSVALEELVDRHLHTNPLDKYRV
jgi:hypothetical protein